MKKYILHIYLLCLVSLLLLPSETHAQCPVVEGGGAFINEFTEYDYVAGRRYTQFLELVVVGDIDNPQASVDLSGWMIDDAHAYGYSGAGYITLGNCFNNISPGTIILLYDPQNIPDEIDSNKDGTPNQDGVYQVPINNSCISTCNNSAYTPCYNSLGGNWNNIHVQLGSEKIQLFDSSGSLQHELLFGSDFSVTPVSVYFPNTKGSASFELEYGCWTDFDSYTYTLGGTGSPGISNNTDNDWLISQIETGAACDANSSVNICSPNGNCQANAGIISPSGPLYVSVEDGATPTFSAAEVSSGSTYIWILENYNGIVNSKEATGQDNNGGFIEVVGGAYCVFGLAYEGSYDDFVAFDFQNIQEVISTINQGIICGELSDCIDLTVHGGCSFANFVMPATSRVGDEVVVVDISMPIPDNIEWSFKDDSGFNAESLITQVGGEMNQGRLIFNEAGIYEISMMAYSGDCIDVVKKRIGIFLNTDEVDVNDPSTGYTKISDFRLYPIPALDYFQVEVQLESIQDIQLTILDSYGILMDLRTSSDEYYYLEDYNIHLEPGIYIMVLRSVREWRSIQFVVQ